MSFIVDFVHLLVDLFDAYADLLEETVDLLFRAPWRNTPFRQHVGDLEHEFREPILLMKPNLPECLSIRLFGAAKFSACFRRRADDTMKIVNRSGQSLHLGRNRASALDQSAGCQTIFVPFIGIDHILMNFLQPEFIE